MNKKLVAVAIAGVLAAPLAQAQTANVTLYGRLNLDMEVVNGKKAAPTASCPTCTTNPNQYRVSSNSSRFGLRGTESLGGGLNAIFQIENGSIAADAGTGGTIGGRDTFIGLQGSWGTFKAGFFSVPYDNMSNIWGNNPTLGTSIFSYDAVWAQGGQSQQAGGFDNRLGNTIQWYSPVISGFQGQVSYSIGGGGAAQESAAPATNSSVTSGGLFYNNGPMMLGAAIQYNSQVRAVGLNDYAWSVAGSYQFPKFKVGVIYEKLDYDFRALANSNNKTSLTRNFFGADVTINAGPGQLYFLWGYGQNGKGSAPNGARIGNLTKGDSTSVNQWQATYTYPLSKRTSVFGGYTQILNKENANYTFGVNSYPVANGGDPQGFAIGMWHNF